MQIQPVSEYTNVVGIYLNRIGFRLISDARKKRDARKQREGNATVKVHLEKVKIKTNLKDPIRYLRRLSSIGYTRLSFR